MKRLNIEKVRAKMAARGFNQKALADAAGVSDSCISLALKGARIYESTLSKIAHALGVRKLSTIEAPLKKTISPEARAAADAMKAQRTIDNSTVARLLVKDGLRWSMINVTVVDTDDKGMILLEREDAA